MSLSAYPQNFISTSFSSSKILLSRIENNNNEKQNNNNKYQNNSILALAKKGLYLVQFWNNPVGSDLFSKKHHIKKNTRNSRQADPRSTITEVDYKRGKWIHQVTARSPKEWRRFWFIHILSYRLTQSEASWKLSSTSDWSMSAWKTVS